MRRPDFQVTKTNLYGNGTRVKYGHFFKSIAFDPAGNIKKVELRSVVGLQRRARTD